MGNYEKKIFIHHNYKFNQIKNVTLQNVTSNDRPLVTINDNMGVVCFDTTLNKMIIWNGLEWELEDSMPSKAQYNIKGNLTNFLYDTVIDQKIKFNPTNNNIKLTVNGVSVPNSKYISATIQNSIDITADTTQISNNNILVKINTPIIGEYLIFTSGNETHYRQVINVTGYIVIYSGYDVPIFDTINKCELIHRNENISLKNDVLLWNNTNDDFYELDIKDIISIIYESNDIGNIE